VVVVGLDRGCGIECWGNFDVWNLMMTTTALSHMHKRGSDEE